MRNVAAAIQTVGLMCGVIAGALVDAALGFAVAAVSLLVVGVSMERGS